MPRDFIKLLRSPGSIKVHTLVLLMHAIIWYVRGWLMCRTGAIHVDVWADVYDVYMVCRVLLCGTYWDCSWRVHVLCICGVCG